MNNFKKIGLSALAGSLVAVSAHAAEITMSGGASVAITSGDETGKSTFYQNDSITFKVAGETDGGLSITTKLFFSPVTTTKGLPLRAGFFISSFFA